MRFSVTQRPSGEHEIFAEDAFSSHIGQVVPFNLKETDDGPVMGQLGEVRLIGAKICAEGRVAVLEFETIPSKKTDDRVEVFKRVAEDAVIPMSFSFRRVAEEIYDI